MSAEGRECGDGGGRTKELSTVKWVRKKHV